LADEKGMSCSKLLADMGADVIKVEPPGGDPARNIGPFVKDEPHPERSLYFWYHNTSKRGITLNLESGEGQEIFRRLIGTTDVVVETFSPGYLKKLSLDYGALKELNPCLIMTSITNFGQTGPYKDYKSCDLVASALGGQMYVCGAPDTPPLKPYGEQAYLVASLFGAIGTILALYYRHFSGQGQHVDISMQECIAAVIEPVNVRYLYDKVVVRRQGNLQWNNAFRLFSCRDGYILLSLFQQWDTLIEWLDSEGMAADLKDEKWRHPEIQLKEKEHIIQVLEQWTRKHTQAELVEQGQLMHFPWAAVDSIKELWDNPQLLERGFFVEVSHPEQEASFKYPGVPYKFSRSPWQISRRAPFIGEHNQQILGEELGFSKAEIADLASRGVI
jgi:crotonobetainyl-CoA:carnitine CoA-transferase CaiB-like acyl-CoA transferase